VLVDMRPPSYYAGLEKKGFISVAGPVPGAVNLPAADLLDAETHLLKDKAGLTDLVRVENLLGTNVGRDEEMLQPLDENTPIITYCNTGRDATTGYFLFRLLGYHKVEMFDGSMAEWSLVTEKTAPSQR
jgi:3-mercaptopyruvate sulfurtransferase SseA